MDLKIGVFDHIEHLPGVPLQQLHAERLEQIEALDQGGFYIYKLAEHHTPAVHCMAPSQSVFLAAAAQRTKNIRLCPCVYVLPIHHPLRLIEEICMVDSLSDGRLEIGVGPGGLLEAYFWGQEGKDDANRERFEEMLHILQEGLAHDELTHRGQYYDFDRVPMRLRPQQAPTPPFWYMRNFATAAHHRMNCICVGDMDQAEANFRAFRRLWTEEHGELLTPQGKEPLVGSAAFIVLADTDEEAWEIARPAQLSFRTNLQVPRRLEAERRGLTQFINTEAPAMMFGQERWISQEEKQFVEQRLARMDAADRAEHDRRIHVGGPAGGVGVSGSPETVRNYIEEYMKTGANYLMTAFQYGNLTHKQAMRSIELFTTKVLPGLNTSVTYGQAEPASSRG